VKKKQDTIA